MRNIEIVYDKLFNRFQFSNSLKDADVIVVPNETEDMPDFSNLARIYLTKPSCLVQETFSDTKGNSVYVIYSNNLSVSEEIVRFLMVRDFTRLKLECYKL